MKKIFLFLSLLSFFSLKANPKTIKTGVYVEDIYKIDYVNSTYDVVLWIWVNSDDEYYDIQKYIDIINSTEINYNYGNQFKLKNGKYHSEIKATVRVLNQYDINKFPFDVQKLNLNIEFFKKTNGYYKIHFDMKNSRFSPEYIEKWRQLQVKTFFIHNHYNSNFGNDDISKKTKYEALKVEIKLKRNQWSLFVKLFLTLFISFFLASFSLFLPNKLSEEKIGLMLASLFASVGNKYITDNALPVQDTLNLSDKLHILTICFIAIFAAYAIYEQRKKLKDNRKVDYLLFFFSTSIYFLFVIILCWH